MLTFLEKAFDIVLCKVIGWDLRKQLVPQKLVELVKNLYQGARSGVDTIGATSTSFEISAGVHLGSDLKLSAL